MEQAMQKLFNITDISFIFVDKCVDLICIFRSQSQDKGILLSV